MARYPEGHKEAARARIVAEAAAVYRELGLDGIGIHALMRRLGLTHGGFYVHFDSRDALAAAAIAEATEQLSKRLTLGEDGAPVGLEQLVARYLSEPHRDHPGQGCPVAALGAEGPRQGPIVQDALARAVRGFFGSIARAAGKRRDLSDEVIGVACVLVGALVLARALGQSDESSKVLAVGRRIARGLIEGR